MKNILNENILCLIFGHKPPVYAKKGWFSPGEEYAKKVIIGEHDGVGRTHAAVICECARCDKNFKICRIHIPKIKYKHDWDK